MQQSALLLLACSTIALVAGRDCTFDDYAMIVTPCLDNTLNEVTGWVARVSLATEPST